LVFLSKVFEARFEVDKERAGRIAKRLYDQFYGQQGFFAGYRMPEYILPRDLVVGSKEHAQYLTFVISIDYMTDAVKLWRNARETYELYPERFNPSEVLALSDRTLMTFLRRLGARYPKAGAQTWKRISKVLVEKYDGDPRRITPEPLSIHEVKSKLEDFPYLKGGKLSNFYLRAMGENNLLKIADFSELDIPVDIQVARFTVYTGVLRLLSDSYEGCVHKNPLRGLIEELWRNAAKEIDTYPWKLDEPIWTVGSKLCSKKECSRCPVKDLCDTTKGVRFRGSVLVWQKPSA
jgi:endonuclease III